MAESLIAGQLDRLRRQRTAPLILDLDLTDGIAEAPPAHPVSAVLSARRSRLADLLDALHRASRDRRVKVLVAKVGGQRIGLATVQEIRRAVEEFRDAGKRAIAWAESFGEFSAGNVPYYLATAFDTIYLQPSGDLGLTGIALEQFFLRGTLDQLGVSFQVARRHEYKSAAEQFTERGFTGPAREATQQLAESVTRQLSEAIAERRGLDPAGVRALIDRGPFLAGQAREAGLVDELGYRDEVYSRARRIAGAEALTVSTGRYQRARALTERARSLSSPRQPHVALIYASGPIRRGRSGRGAVSGNGIGSDTISAALRAAAADDTARAIVLRVNSPGGSYVASDTIWREVVRARNAGKPVVVSMGDVAASGGYYIAMAADAIIAQPGTVTGSIGVLSGKPVLATLLGRAGVTTDSVAEGAHAEMFRPTRPFTDEEWTLVNDWLDHIYADFTGKVAAGRRMPAARVHELARGRVWTGADAVANGLADEIGGLDRAAAIARRRCGLPAAAPLRVYPRPVPMDRLRTLSRADAGETMLSAAGLPGALLPAVLPGGAIAGMAGAAALAALTAETWGPVWQLAARAGLPPYGPLILPGSWTFD